MTRRAVLPLLLLLLAACSSGTVNGVDAILAGGVTGNTEGRSTDDFDVTIVQANTPMVMSGHKTADVRFDIRVKNRTEEPYTIERVVLVSLAGSTYRLPMTTREYRQVVAPGEETKIEYWATSQVDDHTMGAKAPITLRATLDLRSGGGAAREEVFTTRLNGRVAVSATGGD